MYQIQKITSRDNQKLKFARAVREGREDNKIFIEGVRLCEEVVKTKLPIQLIFISSNSLQNSRIIALIDSFQTNKTEILEVEERIFDSLSDTKNSQGIIIIADRPSDGKDILKQNLSQTPFLLLLHKLTNPSNLGAILRTAEAVGVEGIITTKATTDVFSTKALRGGMGANLRLPFWTNADYFEALRWTQDYGIISVCADIRSEKSYLEIDWKVPRMLVVGSEGHGLSDIERSATEESLIIPMDNGVESLNVAVACGVILFEAKRQRGKYKKAS